MAGKTKSKMKGLGSMKHSGKGPIHHIEIHPARTAAGGKAFTTKVIRGRTPEQEKQNATGRGYVPEQTEDKDAEAVHTDGVDMIDHVKGLTGVQDEDPDEGEEDGDDAGGQGA